MSSSPLTTATSTASTESSSASSCRTTRRAACRCWCAARRRHRHPQSRRSSATSTSRRRSSPSPRRQAGIDIDGRPLPGLPFGPAKPGHRAARDRVAGARSLHLLRLSLPRDPHRPLALRRIRDRRSRALRPAQRSRAARFARRRPGLRADRRLPRRGRSSDCGTAPGPDCRERLGPVPAPATAKGGKKWRRSDLRIHYSGEMLKGYSSPRSPEGRSSLVPGRRRGTTSATCW